MRAGAFASLPWNPLLLSGSLPNDELTAWLMSSVIKVPRRYGIVAPHTVELDVKPPAPHQDSLLPQDPPGSLWLAAMCKAQHCFAQDGLDVIEGNEGDFGSLICEA